MAGLGSCVFGLVMFLSALGYVKPEEPDSPLGRIVGGALSLGTACAGVWMLWRGAVSAIKSADLNEGSFPKALIAYLLHTISTRSVWSAMPYLVLAFDFFLAFAFSMTLPLTDMKGLEEVMVVEFLALHSAAFLGIVVAIRTEGFWTLVRLAAGGLLVFIYINLGMKYASASAAVSFVFLAGSRYFNYYMSRPDGGATIQMILRWGVQLLFFILFTALLNESLAGPGNILLGLAYFSTIGLVEALGLLGGKEGADAKDRNV